MTGPYRYNTNNRKKISKIRKLKLGKSANSMYSVHCLSMNKVANKVGVVHKGWVEPMVKECMYMNPL